MKLKSEFTKKAEVLENAAKILKEEFVGIDNIIDEVIDNVRSWYTMSSIQEKPAVINLWGLTGTGKTSLVLRLMELIDFHEKTYRFDLGEKDGSRSFKSSLSDLCENKDDSPIAIILDELQHARTVKGPFREEIDNDKNRMIWELIDSGKVSYLEWKSGLWSFETLSRTLNDLLNAGVRVKNGVVTRHKPLYREEMDIEEEKGSPLLFVPEDEYETIIGLAGEYLKLNLKQDVKELLLSFDGAQTVKFLHRVISIATRPSIKNFNKAVIFILGNVDEAYTMSGNYSADISADEFHEISLKINVPDIKNALRSRFRDEQIARLGNIHVIYPALNSESYYKIIELELNRLKSRVHKMLDLDLEFENSLIEEIYKEGVYPTQGARPLFTTIHQMVKSKLAIHINVILKRNLDANRMILSVDDGQLFCKFFKGKSLKFTYSDTITSNLEVLRKPTLNEEQAIAAVHEAGHAVLSISLMKVVPELIVSVTSDTGALGFMYSKDEKNYTARQDVIPKTAMLLGGVVAEELIFGDDYLTAGGGSDIRRATESLMSLYKKHGFGSLPIAHGVSNKEDSYVYHQITEVEGEVKRIIEIAKTEARKELIKEKELLLTFADILSVRPRIEKEEIVELIASHSTVKIPNATSDNYYRETLKMQVETKQVLSDVMGKNPLVLNKEK